MSILQFINLQNNVNADIDNITKINDSNLNPSDDKFNKSLSVGVNINFIRQNPN